MTTLGAPAATIREGIANLRVISVALMSVSISAGEASYIVDGVNHDMRCDGRTRSEYRSMTLEMGLLPQCNGSARIKVSNHSA